jgi:hypothetical protein
VGVEEGEGVGVWEGTGVKVDTGVKEGGGIAVKVEVAVFCAPVELQALVARIRNSRISGLYIIVL